MWLLGTAVIGIGALLWYVRSAARTAEIESDLASAKAGEIDAPGRVLVREAEASEPKVTELKVEADVAAGDVAIAVERVRDMDAEQIASEFKRVRR